MDTLLILVAVVALIAIVWIVYSLWRGRDTASAAPTTPAIPTTGTTGHTGDPVSTAYERELAGAGTHGSGLPAGRTEPATAAPAHVENLRTGAALAAGAAAEAAQAAAATMAGAGAAPTAPSSPPSSPLSTAYEADLAQSGARSAPAPAARDVADNLRTDPDARDGTVAPRPLPDVAADFVETPLPEPAPSDAAAATGGLETMTPDEPEGPGEEDDDHRRPGFTT